MQFRQLINIFNLCLPGFNTLFHSVNYPINLWEHMEQFIKLPICFILTWKIYQRVRNTTWPENTIYLRNTTFNWRSLQKGYQNFIIFFFLGKLPHNIFFLTDLINNFENLFVNSWSSIFGPILRITVWIPTISIAMFYIFHSTL